MGSKMEVLSGGEEMLDQIEVMWRSLTLHAARRSRHFSDHFADRTFEQRRRELSDKAAAGRLRISIVRDGRSGRDMGYCVSSIGPDRRAEVESLYVDEQSRGQGVGDTLLADATAWMEENGAISIAVFTVYGSDEVLPFYARHGYLPKMVMLERKAEQQR